MRLHTGRSPLARIRVRAGAIAKPRIAVAVLRAAGGYYRRGRRRQRQIANEHCQHTPRVLGGCVCVRGVAAGLACLKYSACIDHGHDLLLQPLHKLLAQLSSQAKKAETFLNLCTSPYSWRFFDSNRRMRWCSAVVGFPIPLRPACSASN